MKCSALILSIFSVCAIKTVRADDWPEFRGPGGQGHAKAEGLPVEWNPGTEFVWRKNLPGLAWSSPIVIGSRVFLTNAVENDDGGVSLRVVALDAETGAGIWDVEVFAQDDPGYKHSKNSHASPTPIHENGRIYAHFGHLGTACLDADSGEVRWRQDRLRYAPVHGMGGSPILVGGKLIFHCDGATDPFVVALHKDSGEVAWKTDRKVEVAKPLLLFHSAGDPRRTRRPDRQPRQRRGDRLRSRRRQGSLEIPIWRRIFGGAAASVRPRPDLCLFRI